MLYMFDAQSAQLEDILQVSTGEIIGLCHHPNRNLVATVSAEGELKLWKP